MNSVYLYFKGPVSIYDLHIAGPISIILTRILPVLQVLLMPLKDSLI